VLSPDGARVVAVRNDSIFAYAADDGEPALLGVHTVDPWNPHSFAWSPDGRWIAYVNGNSAWRFQGNWSTASVWIISADGGDPVPVTDETTMNLSPQWLSDSRHLLFVSNRDGPRGIYVVEVGPDGVVGAPRSVPGASDPHSASVSADGRRLAYSKFTWVQNIWSIPIPQVGVVSIREAVPVSRDVQVIEAHALSPDGEWIAFDSDVRGEFDIHKMRLDGGAPELVADLTGDVFAPAWSPDGTEITFYNSGLEGAGGMGEVCVVSADGRTPPEQLTDFPGFDIEPDWSPDGLTIAFWSQGPRGPEAGRMWVWIVSRDSVGGQWSEPVQLTDFPCARPTWAPHEASLVCDAGHEIALVSQGGDVLAMHAMPPGLVDTRRPTFSRDGSRIYFRATHEDGSDGLWWIPTSGGAATKVVAFDDPAVTVVGSPTVGQEHVYLTIAEYESDIWVMDLEW
jgi:Tol biopolymer transport system component